MVLLVDITLVLSSMALEVKGKSQEEGFSMQHQKCCGRRGLLILTYILSPTWLSTLIACMLHVARSRQEKGIIFETCTDDGKVPGAR
jgi:hypothetical protein